MSVDLLLAFLLSACLPTPSGVVADRDMTLSVQNGTTRPTVLFVSGQRIADLDPGSAVEIPAQALPPLPWDAEIRLPTGRLLVALRVHSGDVIVGESFQKGDGARVDLSCGRIDLWSGPPLIGPAPGQGIPGDCDP